VVGPPLLNHDYLKPTETTVPSIHALSLEFELAEQEVLDLIQSAPPLKMAVRGWVAEAHLENQLLSLPEIEECVRIEEDGKPDFKVSSPLRSADCT